jgi:hypothetical protein
MTERHMKKGGWHTWIELPSSEEIEASDSQREQAIESLLSELSASSIESVRCQQCRVPVSIPPPSVLKTGYSNRIITLQRRLKYALERYPNSDGCRQLKHELSDLLKKQAKRDIIRRLPLVSTKATGYKYVCSACFDKAYEAVYYKRSHEYSS